MSSRPFIAARIELRVNRRVEAVLRRLGWHEALINYTGYGNVGNIRVLGRLVLVPRKSHTFLGAKAEELMARRGWRNFLTAAVVSKPATITVRGKDIMVGTDRGGYIDVLVPDHGLAPGWHTVTLRTDSAEPVDAKVMVVADDVTFGIVSDIDDTIISTWLPRPMIAAWNSFVLQETNRQAVPGMAEMYHTLLDEHPGAPIVYVSTGAWNTEPFLNRFLRHHNYPPGPILLTDWGPTNAGWFRSGKDHKTASLRQLARDFPGIAWVLVGDDGQHDPVIYAEFADLSPRNVRAIAIRELNPVEQVLAHGTPLQRVDSELRDYHGSVTEVRGPEGYTLLRKVALALRSGSAR